MPVCVCVYRRVDGKFRLREMDDKERGKRERERHHHLSLLVRPRRENYHEIHILTFRGIEKNKGGLRRNNYGSRFGRHAPEPIRSQRCTPCSRLIGPSAKTGVSRTLLSTSATADYAVPVFQSADH